MGAIVVVPNHLPHFNFLEEWDELQDVEVIVVQDGPDAPEVPASHWMNTSVFTWDHIDQELGDNAWIIPRRTSAVRSFGYLKAWQRNPDVILTLDNDCYPDSPSWLAKHRENLASSRTLDWVSGSDSIEFTRGFPYRIRNQAKVKLSHGLWSNVPDLDAATALHHPNLRCEPSETTWVLPRWSFFPMCGMNLAWTADLTPAMYFGLFGPDYGFDQYDDIWAGVLVKKVLDHLGFAAVTGAPSVEHRKQSDVFVNLRKQAPGLEMNENLWRQVARIGLSEQTVRGAYIELVDRLPDVIEGEPVGYTRKFKRAALLWAGLFQ